MKHYSTAGAHQPFIQSRLLLMYSGLATSHAGHHQTIEQKWLRGNLSEVVQGCVQRGWQGWNEQFPFRQEEFRNQCSAKRELFTLQTCSLREST